MHKAYTVFVRNLVLTDLNKNPSIRTAYDVNLKYQIRMICQS